MGTENSLLTINVQNDQQQAKIRYLANLISLRPQEQPLAEQKKTTAEQKRTPTDKKQPAATTQSAHQPPSTARGAAAGMAIGRTVKDTAPVTRTQTPTPNVPTQDRFTVPTAIPGILQVKRERAPRSKRPTIADYLETSGFKLSTEEAAIHLRLLKRWDERPPSIKAATGEEYQQNKRLKLDLVSMASPLEREEEFDRRRDYLDWSYGTASTYWSAMIKATEEVGHPDRHVEYSMRIKAKVLAFLAKEELPDRPTIPLSFQQLLDALVHLHQDLQAAVTCSWVLGQRMGDTLKLSIGSLTVVTDLASNTKFLCLLFRRGKTTRRRQPFTLHLPLDHPAAIQMQDLYSRCSHLPPTDPLFLTQIGEAETALEQIRHALKAVDDSLSILSIRRGGLQQMAQMGLSDAVLLHHSRHAEIGLLHRYLDWGRLALNPARERFGLDGQGATHGAAAAMEKAMTEAFTRSLTVSTSNAVDGDDTA